MLRTTITSNKEYLKILGLNIHNSEKVNEGLKSKVAGMFLRYEQGKEAWQDFEVAILRATKSVLGPTQLNFLSKIPNSLLKIFNLKLQESGYKKEIWHAFRNFFDGSKKSDKGNRLIKALNKKSQADVVKFWQKMVCVIYKICFHLSNFIRMN